MLKLFKYLESILISKSKRSKCSSLKWNKFRNATGGNESNRLPLSDKFVKLLNFDNCKVGTICKENKNKFC